MKGVRPIQRESRVSHPTGVQVTPGHVRRRASAVLEPETGSSNLLSTEIPQRYGPHDPLEFRRDGVQQGVFRKLKQGA